jgi:proteasome lid subunit RPN8/RPN11
MIDLKQTQIDEIRRHGERDYPYECCGRLSGHPSEEGRKVVIETYQISNAREEEAKRNRFLIRPEELMRGERHAHEQQLEVIGFYHSHPDDLAVPSHYDLEHAWPVYSYIIVSVLEGRADKLLSWEMAADRSKFNPEEIRTGIDAGVS